MRNPVPRVIVRTLPLTALAILGCYDPYGLQMEATDWDKQGSQHFVYHLQRGTPLSPGGLERNLETLETQYARLSDLLDLEPRAMVHCYHYMNSSQMARAVGIVGLHGARAIQCGDIGEIHFHRLFDNTLRHELVHIFGYRMKARLAPGILTEGLAVCYEEVGENLNVHSRARNLRITGDSKPLTSILTQYSISGDVDAYSQAGSFVKYLIDTYGIEVFKEFYRGSSASQLSTAEHIFITASEVYGKSFFDLEQEWTLFLGPVDED